MNLKVFSFTEGARLQAGGMGLVAVPGIMKALADRGHTVVVAMGGRVNPGAEQFVQPDVASALNNNSGRGTFGIVTFPAYGRWSFSPKLLFQLSRYIQDADFVTLHSLYSFPVLAGYLLARAHGKPYAIWPHGVLAPFQRRVSLGKKRIYDWIVARRLLNGAHLLVYSAVGEREESRSLGLTSPSVIIPDAFDAREYQALPPRGRFRGKYLQGYPGPLVLFLSRLNAKKGLDILVRAFALVLEQMPEARLAIVGSGDPPQFVTEVKGWLRQCNLEEHVPMPGLLIGKDKLQAFADADVFVLPSQAENFGFAMFEAMASRIPVVISDTLNYAGEVRQRRAGLVVRRDPHEFANAILVLLRDPLLQKQMGENGLQMANSLSREACGERVERAIQVALQGQPLPSSLKPDE